MDKVLKNLHWLGHASFRLDASQIIYFDPWKLREGSRPANIILISHEHFDHCSLEDIRLICSSGTVVVTDRTVAKQLQAARIDCKKIVALLPGESVDISGIAIQAVPSYNTNKQFHTRESKKVGFVVTVDGVSIYHAGDTDKVPEMRDYRCDIALLPVSGTYVMTADEAAEAVLEIKPSVAIPMHYGDIVGTGADAQRFKELLEGKVEARILEKES